jgi:hypothetical protein
LIVQLVVYTPNKLFQAHLWGVTEVG